MENTKLLKLILNFNGWEIRELYQFLESPFYNRRTDVIELLNFIKKEEKDKNADFNRKKAFRAVYKTDDYSEKNWYLLSSYLFRLVEDFLAARSMQKDDFTKKLHLARAYKEISFDKSFLRVVKDAKKELDKTTWRNGTYYKQFYDLELERYGYFESRSRSKENNLQELSDQFDIYYIAEKLKQYCLQLSHQNVFKKDYQQALQNEVIAFVKGHPDLLVHPAIAVYYYGYQAISTGADTFFQKLLSLLPEYKDQFQKEEIRGIYFMTINFCIKQFNAGLEKYEMKTFELYKSGIEQGFLVEKDMHFKFTFNNTALLGIKLKEFQWVEQFITKYQEYLIDKDRKNIANYSLSILRYEQGNYKEAMQLLSSFESDDHLMNLGAKLTLLKIYYELEEFDPLDSLLASMRVYLQRKGIITYHKESYGNIIFLLKKLLALEPFNKKAKMKLEKAILTKKPLTRNIKEWLLKQLKNS